MTAVKSILLHISSRGVRPSRTYQSPGIPSLVAVDNVPVDVDPNVVAAQFARIKFMPLRARVDWDQFKDLPEGAKYPEPDVAPSVEN